MFTRTRPWVLRGAMKTVTTIFILLLSQSLLWGQTIWLADNNFNAPTGPYVLSTIQAAVDAASNGDIVQVQPSPNTYGSVSINKQITLQGIGFNLTKDIPLTTTMGSITLTNNSDNTSDADGTIITGLSFGALNVGAETGPDFLLENILVTNCSFSYVYAASGSSYSPTDGLELRDVYIWGSTSSWGIYLYKPISNLLVRNSLILNSIGFFSSTTNVELHNNLLYGHIRQDNATDETLIKNNVFIGATGTAAAFNTEFVDGQIENNIFYGVTPSIAVGGSSSTLFQNNTFDNNLVHSSGDNTMPPTGGGIGNDGTANLVGSPLFTNSELLNTWLSSYDFTPQVGSPALGNGSGGTDIGLFGGDYPWTDPNFVLDPSKVPTIETLNTSTVINPGSDLPIRVIINGN